MSRPLRICFANGVFHITSRGNNREKIFLEEKDFLRYKALLRRYRAKFEFKLYAYCLMPNHVHLLIETSPSGSISKIMHAINTAYAMYFNSKYDHVGHVFQGRFYSSIIDTEHYLLEVMRYMDLNPVRAEIVKRPEEYEWTSYHRCAKGRSDNLVDFHELYENLGEGDRDRQREYRKFVKERMEGGPGLWQPVYAYSIFIGGEDFVSRLTELYGQQIWPKYRRLLDQLHELRAAALVE